VEKKVILDNWIVARPYGRAFLEQPNRSLKQQQLRRLEAAYDRRFCAVALRKLFI